MKVVEDAHHTQFSDKLRMDRPNMEENIGISVLCTFPDIVKSPLPNCLPKNREFHNEGRCIQSVGDRFDLNRIDMGPH